jgi:hypothetical protein
MDKFDKLVFVKGNLHLLDEKWMSLMGRTNDVGWGSE